MFPYSQPIGKSDACNAYHIKFQTNFKYSTGFKFVTAFDLYLFGEIKFDKENFN